MSVYLLPLLPPLPFNLTPGHQESKSQNEFCPQSLIFVSKQEILWGHREVVRMNTETSSEDEHIVVRTDVDGFLHISLCTPSTSFQILLEAETTYSAFTISYDLTLQPAGEKYDIT